MGISLPTVRKFLCCIALETGGLILGYLSAILSIIAIISISATFIVLVIAYNGTSNENTNNTAFVISELLKPLHKKR